MRPVAATQWLIAATLLIYALALFAALGAMAVVVVLAAAAAAALGANVTTGLPLRVLAATAVNVVFGSWLATVLIGFTVDRQTPTALGTLEATRETLVIQSALGWLLLLIAVNVTAAAVHLARPSTWRE